MKKIILIGGPSGSGKTTLCNLLNEKLRDYNQKVLRISTGDLYVIFYKNFLNLDVHRDEIKYSNWFNINHYIVFSMITMISSIDHDILLLDTHYAIKCMNYYTTGLNEFELHLLGKNFCKKYNTSYLFLITTDISSLKKRIKKDVSRNRNLSIIEEEIKFSRKYFKKYNEILKFYIPTKSYEINNENLYNSIDSILELLNFKNK